MSYIETTVANIKAITGCVNTFNAAIKTIIIILLEWTLSIFFTKYIAGVATIVNKIKSGIL